MKLLLYVMLYLSLGLYFTACAQKGDIGEGGATGTISNPPIVTDPMQTTVDAILADENDYRLGLGQTALTAGLSCTLYTVTGGDRIQASIAGHNTLTGLVSVATYTYKGVFNQPDSPASDGMNVLPPALKSIYTNMYLLRCQGQMVVTETGYYTMSLESDDASVFYLDGSKLIDNDNNHGSTLMLGQKYLRKGVHAFRLDYAQAGGGNQSLILKANGALIDGRVYAH